MVVNIISLIMLVIPSAITSESSWTSPDVRIVEEWSLNVMDLVDPVYGQLGTVYGVESEEGFEWHTVLVDKECVLLLECDTVVNSIPYSGDIYRLTFSPDCQYLLGYCYFDEKLILFDLAESTVKSIPLFSSGMGLSGNPLIRVTNDGTVLVKHYTYLRMYDSDFNCTLSRDNFSWGHAFVGLSNAGDRFYTTTYDSLRAFDMQGDLLWNRELFEPDDSRLVHTRNLMLSHDGTFITVLDLYKLQIISTVQGDQIARLEFTERVHDPSISESDSVMVLSYFTDVSIGAKSISLLEGDFEIKESLSMNDHRSIPEMPVNFISDSASDEGYILAILPYQHNTRLFGRIVLLSSTMDIIWLSNSLTDDLHAEFVNSYTGFRNDNSGFWYFDGENIHSCLIEGI